MLKRDRIDFYMSFERIVRKSTKTPDSLINGYKTVYICILRIYSCLWQHLL